MSSQQLKALRNLRHKLAEEDDVDFASVGYVVEQLTGQAS